MFNIKSSSCLAVAAFLLTAAASATVQPGMAPTGTFVSLRVSGSHAAYGVILSPTRILVPAHAVGGAIASYSILAGSSDRTVTTCGTCQLRTALSIVRHPSYINGAPYSNDLAIIHVSALTFNSSVSGALIAASFSNAVGTQFKQIGFGLNGTNHNVLQTTIVSPWTLATTAGYTYTPGDFVTATVDTTVNGMINYYSTANHLQTYTKLSDYITWINAN